MPVLSSAKASELAGKMLDVWAKAHDVPDGVRPDYDRLENRLGSMAIEADCITCDDACVLREALEAERKARGWPGSDPKRIDPGVEGAITAYVSLVLRK